MEVFFRNTNIETHVPNFCFGKGNTGYEGKKRKGLRKEDI